MKARHLLPPLAAVVLGILIYASAGTGKRGGADIPRGGAATGRPVETPETPPGVPGVFIRHTGYALSYNCEEHNPNWVAWSLTADRTDGPYGRTNDFRADPALPAEHQVGANAYRGTGYDRGHMCPAADMKWSAEAMSDCFYMTNMCPQTRALNGRWWEHLETACRRWAAREGCVYICCGPLYGELRSYIDRDVRVTIPEGFFKVVLSLREGHEKAVAFVYANTDDRQPMEDVACTVDAVEALTGYDFFPQVDDSIERAVEARFDLRDWDR